MEKPNKTLLEELGIELKRDAGTVKVKCPKCSHDRKKKNDPCLSVNIDEGNYKCHNCDWKGHVSNKPVFEKKEYIIPVYNNRTDLPKQVVDWFFTRGIGQQTLIDLKITAGPEYMPQTQKHENTIQFNYFRDEKLINVKYRDGRKNFKLVKDAELIFYNLNSIKGATECIITEGEIDTLSWHETEYRAIVSVPNGASKNQKLEYLDNCYQYFDGIKKIYLSTDDDERGHDLRDELCRRLGTERCFQVSYNGLKDANEYLCQHGKDKLLQLLKSATDFPITGVFTLADCEASLDDYFYNGLPNTDLTGDVQLDEHIRFMPGELTIITGIPSHGKSSLLEQISLKLCINAGWTFAAFSPESYPAQFYHARLIKKITGKPFNSAEISQSEYQYAKEWINGRFNMILPHDEGFSIDVILDKARQLVLRKGIKGLIIDPWNRIESTIQNGYNEGKFTIEQLTKIVNFNQRTGVHTFLVAHPTKQQKDKDGINYTIPNLYSISGSAHFFNITQNGMTVFRNDETGLTELHIQKVKWEALGKKGTVDYRFDERSTRLYHAGDQWPDNSSWLNSITNKQDAVNESIAISAKEGGDPPF